jgi:hypothetical protein
MHIHRCFLATFVLPTLATPLAGCKAVYAPNIAATPLLRERGELRATVDVRNLQLAYAVTDHVGVQANGYHRTDSNDPDPGGEQQDGSGTFGELGVGYFMPLAAVHPWLQLEVYAGFGAGKVEHDLTPDGGSTRHFEAEATRAYLVPTLGVTRTWFDLAVSTRVASVRYADVATESYTAEQLEGDGFAGIEDHTWVFLEPCATVRVGYKWVKLQVQVGKSFKLNSAELAHDSGMTTVGLNVDLFRAFGDQP